MNNGIVNSNQSERERAGLQNHGTYGGTLLDPRWKSRRQEILNRDNNKCINCGSEEDLQVHHRQYHFSTGLNKYRNPWEYSERYLITLCGKCHKKGHHTYKVPVKTVS
ncbi:MAG TPA: HNH endonuclease [Bacteroidales bacterium]|nr:HNH endonuclease [Bacteroidales bacterium]